MYFSFSLKKKKEQKIFLNSRDRQYELETGLRLKYKRGREKNAPVLYKPHPLWQKDLTGLLVKT